MSIQVVLCYDLIRFKRWERGDGQLDLIEAIHGRRSIGRVKSDQVERKLIEQIIEAGTWAPNHHLTEPWRFIVMSGEGRKTLGKAYADIAMETIAGSLSDEEITQQYDKQMAKAFRAPVVIAVIVSPADDPKIPLIEEMAAVHSAIQNMLLTAHSLGLGSIWRTGAPTYHALMKSAFELQTNDHLAGFIYLGYPDMSSPKVKRKDYKEKTIWLG